MRSKDLGCHLGNMFVGIVMYADDIILLSASVVDLQKMLVICNSVGINLGLKFNPSKSKCIFVGPNLNVKPVDLFLDSFQLPWVNELSYLGITLLKAKSFLIDLSCVRRKFFVSINVILSKCGFTTDLVKLRLLESHCLPILLYASESLNLPKFQIAEMNSWWNCVYRKIFKYNKWESVRLLIYMLGRLDLIHIINFRSMMFVYRILRNSNTQDIFNMYLHNVYRMSNECMSLFKKCDCCSDWSISKIKFAMYDNLRISCCNDI